MIESLSPGSFVIFFIYFSVTDPWANNLIRPGELGPIMNSKKNSFEKILLFMGVGILPFPQWVH